VQILANVLPRFVEATAGVLALLQINCCIFKLLACQSMSVYVSTFSVK